MNCRLYSSACIAFIFLLITGLNAQVKENYILQITEIDQDGKYLQSGSINPNFINRRLADINSRLAISINRHELLQRLGQSDRFSIPAATQQLLDQLVATMEMEKTLLEKFNSALATYKRGQMDAAANRQFNTDLQQVAIALLTIFRADPTVQDYYEDEASDAKLIAPVFTAISRRINELETTLIRNNKDSNTNVRMGAWIYTKGSFIPVHLPGYDRLPQGEYFLLDRWNFLPSPAQLAQLKQLQQLAKENRDAGLQILNKAADEVISELTAALKSWASQRFSDINAELESVKTSVVRSQLPAALKALEKLFDNWLKQVTDKFNYYANLKTVTNFGLENFFSTLAVDIDSLNKSSKALVQRFDDVLTTIQSLKDPIKAKASNLVRLLTDKKIELSRQFSALRLDELVEGNKLNTDVLEFSDEVIRMSLNDLPSTELDLAFTGARQAGDKIVIKLETSSGTTPTTFPLETREIGLYRVATHLEGTVGLIFADPFGKTNISKKFQMAPYYNLLVKGAWPFGEKYRRRSVINNTIAEFSWGLHVSSPDFNKDDVPELAVGFVMTALKDYIQVGIAHNIFENKPFWFFGLRLPVPAMNFGGGGSTNIQQ